MVAAAPPRVSYAGIATRGIALAVDSALANAIVILIAALLALIGVARRRPAAGVARGAARGRRVADAPGRLLHALLVDHRADAGNAADAPAGRDLQAASGCTSSAR